MKNIVLNGFQNDRQLTTNDDTNDLVVTPALNFTTREDATFQMDTQNPRNVTSMSIVPKNTQTYLTTTTLVTNIIIDKNDSPIHVILGKLVNFKPSS